jgi:restriction endonuclease S subunit
MTNASGASAQAHLYISATKQMPVPIPPLDEQIEIVRIVDGAMQRHTDVLNIVENELRVSA